MNGNFCTHCGYNPDVTVTDPTMLRPGSILLGKYIVGKVIGKGGFGITYLAYDNNANRKVAIKEFFPYGVALRATGMATVNVSNEDNAEAFRLGAEKFYNEAKLVSKFNGNPNIVGVYEFFYENDTVYFAMEYLKGQSLKDYINKNGMLSAPQALFIMKNAANALMAAHSSNVLHRDISPDNIIVCDNGDIKLIDFGAARQVVAEHSQSFSVILKPGFAPLEQYQKKGNQGPWTDIYALGATVYYTLTGDIPEDPMTRLDDDEKFQSNEFGVNEEMWNIIQKATQLKIEDRYGDIFRLLNDINAVSFEPKPLFTAEQPQETMPQFRTAAVFGTTQPVSQTPPQSAQQPVGVGAPAQYVPQSVQPVPQSNAPSASQSAVKSEADLAIERTEKKKKTKIIAICSGVLVVAAAIIIPISVNSGAKRSSPPVTTSKPSYITSQTVSQTVSQSDTQKVTDQKYTKSNGTQITYTGDWANNAPNGKGKGVWEDGSGVYDGEWKDGKRSGQGRWDIGAGDFKGDYYVGEWKDDKPNGHGVYTWAGDRKGQVYDGEFKDGKKSGKGKITYANGDVYDGEWKDDKKNGQGTYKWAEGGVYVGEYKDGVRNGQGKYTDKNGKVQNGEWKDGAFVGGSGSNNNGGGTETVTNAEYKADRGNNPIIYSGDWKDNKPNGQGTGKWTNAIFKNSWVYKGSWVDGCRDGKGYIEYYDENGKLTGTYDGEWSGNTHNGQGTYIQYDQNGKEESRQTGTWKNGIFVG